MEKSVFLAPDWISPMKKSKTKQGKPKRSDRGHIKGSIDGCIVEAVVDDRHERANYQTNNATKVQTYECSRISTVGRPEGVIENRGGEADERRDNEHQQWPALNINRTNKQWPAVDINSRLSQRCVELLPQSTMGDCGCVHLASCNQQATK